MARDRSGCSPVISVGSMKMGRVWLRQRRRRSMLVASFLLIVFVCSLLSFWRTPTSYQGSNYYDIKLDDSRLSWSRSKLRHFKIVDDSEIFLYSAIANYQEPAEGSLNIVISGFDSTNTDSLQCCVLMKGDKLYTSQAAIFYRFYNEPSFVGPYVQAMYWKAVTKAKQYVCVVPEFGYEATHVTLTSYSCPVVVDEYLPVIYPKKVPGGLAICGKVAFGDALDPNKLMEWFEIQRLLGVDHIQIMDADNPEPVQKVFRYYKDMGLLNPLPYELPGVPYGRGLGLKNWVKEQGDHDKSFPILDCTQRLKGYTYVMGIDMDEVLMPAKHDNIKDFAKEMFTANPDAAGFFFLTEFFVYDWGPTNSSSDITMLRYLNSTVARNECKKYIYLTHRIHQARTHDFTPRASYLQYWVSKEEAVLHHYRQCPHVWPTCYPKRVTDSSMLRFETQVVERVEQARQATGIRPTTS